MQIILFILGTLYLTMKQNTGKCTPIIFSFFLKQNEDDDHEIKNNFDLGTKSSTYTSAMTAWTNYIGIRNPNPLEPNSHYYSFNHGNTAFFVMDTRAYRSEDTQVSLLF